ncbi:uncharacterized protein Tco025E_00938 [Trypanosoma conorhini]|uniref:Uncharacterized protein n=1 Tax=Trypanosoma conorhini TaxID=83891 RepID=A0A3R7LL62_9TRYP|nr:uncharacterized protein Tco025E_00938 [Trypanosoma conorhini]RNF26856.1 hypothetical protein Tco025E_00938 [Trypanosoma conorhini]
MFLCIVFYLVLHLIPSRSLLDKSLRGTGNVRQMTSQSNRYLFGNDFGCIVRENQREKPWYGLDWKDCLNDQTAYVVSAGGSFLLLFAFGALCIRVNDACLLVDRKGPCCRCLGEHEAASLQYRQSSASRAPI